MNVKVQQFVLDVNSLTQINFIWIKANVNVILRLFYQLHKNALVKIIIYYLGCDRYCESCFGSNSNECYSCVTDFHRSIFEFECKCIDGYYDDGYNL